MKFEKLASGYYLEALCVVGDTIWLSDVTRGGIRRIGADGRTDMFFPELHMLAAVVANADGRMLISGLGGIRWLDPETGAHGMLISELDGQPIGGVNEMAPDGKGGLYFGTIDLPAVLRAERPGPSALYHLDKSGRVRKFDDGLKFSNGIGVTSDGKRIIHNESFNGVYAYDIAADGSIGPAQKLMDKYDCDGIAMDREGGAWICGFTTPELIRIGRDGAIDQRLAFPGQGATNVCFAGAGGRDVYITAVTAESVTRLVKMDPITAADSHLYRARGEIAGHDAAPPQFQLT